RSKHRLQPLTDNTPQTTLRLSSASLLDPQMPTSPRIHRTLDRSTIRRHIIAVSTGSIDRHDLVNRCAHMPHQRNRHLPAHIAIPDEPVPVVKAIFPTLHQGIATPVL